VADPTTILPEPGLLTERTTGPRPATVSGRTSVPAILWAIWRAAPWLSCLTPW